MENINSAMQLDPAGFYDTEADAPQKVLTAEEAQHNKIKDLSDQYTLTVLGLVYTNDQDVTGPEFGAIRFHVATNLDRMGRKVYELAQQHFEGEKAQWIHVIEEKTQDLKEHKAAIDEWERTHIERQKVLDSKDAEIQRLQARNTETENQLGIVQLDNQKLEEDRDHWQESAISREALIQSLQESETELHRQLKDVTEQRDRVIKGLAGKALGVDKAEDVSEAVHKAAQKMLVHPEPLVVYPEEVLHPRTTQSEVGRAFNPLGAVCRNCGNTGVGFNGTLCNCATKHSNPNPGQKPTLKEAMAARITELEKEAEDRKNNPKRYDHTDELSEKATDDIICYLDVNPSISIKYKVFECIRKACNVSIMQS